MPLRKLINKKIDITIVSWYMIIVGIILFANGSFILLQVSRKQLDVDLSDAIIGYQILFFESHNAIVMGIGYAIEGVLTIVAGFLMLKKHFIGWWASLILWSHGLLLYILLADSMPIVSYISALVTILFLLWLFWRRKDFGVCIGAAVTKS